jgi:hypothetical protein
MGLRVIFSDHVLTERDTENRRTYFTNHILTGQKRPLALDLNAARPPRVVGR